MLEEVAGLRVFILQVGKREKEPPPARQSPLGVFRNLFVLSHIISEPAMPFARILGMNLLSNCRNSFVFLLAVALFPTYPLVI